MILAVITFSVVVATVVVTVTVPGNCVSGVRHRSVSCLPAVTVVFAAVKLRVVVTDCVPVVTTVEVHGASGKLEEQYNAAGGKVERGARVS